MRAFRLMLHYCFFCAMLAGAVACHPDAAVVARLRQLQHMLLRHDGIWCQKLSPLWRRLAWPMRWPGYGYGVFQAVFFPEMVESRMKGEGYCTAILALAASLPRAEAVLLEKSAEEIRLKHLM